MKLWLGMVITGLLIAVQHWFPWRKLPGLKGANLPPRLAAYVLGVLAIAGPLTGVFLSWGNSAAVWALWALIFTAGGTTFLVYFGDWLLKVLKEKNEAEEREMKLLEE